MTYEIKYTNTGFDIYQDNIRFVSQPIDPFTGLAFIDKVAVDNYLNMYFAWVKTAEEIVIETSNETVIRNLTLKLEEFYDTKAKEKNYDNRITCALRAGLTGSPFQPEGLAFGVWMDNCNLYGYKVIQTCLHGEREIPTGTQLISELPELVW